MPKKGVWGHTGFGSAKVSHTGEKHPTPTEEAWQKEFNETFDVRIWHLYPYQDIQSFIRSLLSKQKKATLQEVLEQLEHHFSSVADINGDEEFLSVGRIKDELRQKIQSLMKEDDE